MKFPYTEVTRYFKGVADNVLLPWLPVEIAPKKDFSNSQRPLGLLDSGADYSIVTREIGEDLDIDVENGEPHTIYGVGGGSVEGFIHTVYHRIHGPQKSDEPIVFRGIIVFSKYDFPTSMPQATALWGRESIFSNTIVEFDDPYSFELYR